MIKNAIPYDMKENAKALRAIQNTTQHVVSAISSAMGVDVAIIDTDFRIVATSKTFLETRGTDVNSDFIRHVYRIGTAVITNPGDHEFCRGCSYEGNCPETAEVIKVIEQDGTRYGVLLMVAYTRAQKEKILNQTSELLAFIGSMASLIFGEIQLQKSLKKESIVKQQLETTINSVDHGIIAIDKSGCITQINRQAKLILHISGKELANARHLRHYLPYQLIRQALQQGLKLEQCEFHTRHPDRIHCLVSATPVMVSRSVVGAVFRLQDFREIRSTVYKLSAKHKETSFDDILGESTVFREVKIRAASISRNDSTILIQGESGTGKELFARAIHNQSPRNHQPFIGINCGAIPETLLESELFGYDDGAFSGARKGGKPGKFELADGGTLFLDEVGDMPLHMQVKLLRVLQEAVVERVGGISTIPVDVRILSATNIDLETLVRKGRFRQDLYYRLNVMPITIPPLRKRPQDIPILAKRFLAKYNQKMQRHFTAFSGEVLDLLSTYHWPGNVRELQNAIEHAVNIETAPLIKPGSLPAAISKRSPTKARARSLTQKVRDYERSLINDAIESFGHSVEGKKRAAAKLGISLPTLYRKLKELDPEIPRTTTGQKIGLAQSPPPVVKQ